MISLTQQTRGVTVFRNDSRHHPLFHSPSTLRFPFLNTGTRVYCTCAQGDTEKNNLIFIAMMFEEHLACSFSIFNPLSDLTIIKGQTNYFTILSEGA